MTSTGHYQSSPTRCTYPPTVHWVSLTQYYRQKSVKLCKDGYVWGYDFCYGEELTIHFIYMPDFVVINTTYILIHQCELFWGWMSAGGMSHPDVSTF